MERKNEREKEEKIISRNGRRMIDGARECNYNLSFFSPFFFFLLSQPMIPASERIFHEDTSRSERAERILSSKFRVE